VNITNCRKIAAATFGFNFGMYCTIVSPNIGVSWDSIAAATFGIFLWKQKTDLSNELPRNSVTVHDVDKNKML
jgi:hypothetical protein